MIAREGAAPNPRLTYLIDRYLREPLQQAVATIRAGQRAGVIAADVRPDLLLFLVLGAGSHLFDITAFARETLGIDASASGTREAFLALLRTLLERGLLSPTATPCRTRENT